MTNSLLDESESWDPSWIAALLRRAENEGSPFALNLVQAAYGAEERRYADRFVVGLKAAHVEIGQAPLHVMNFMPSPQAGTNIESLLPVEGQDLAAAQSTRLPKRDFATRLDFRLLSALGNGSLGTWLVSENAFSHAVPLLRIASMVAPDVARDAVTSVGAGALRELILGASPDVALEVMDAVREANMEVAVELQAQVGESYIVNQAVAAPDGCFAIQLNEPLVRGRFLAEVDEDALERAVRVTTRLYRLFPAATESEVVGLLDVGMEAPFAHLQIPRANLAPNAWRITANQFWLSLCTERLGGASVAAVVRQQHQYVKDLLGAMRETHGALSDSATTKQRAALALWADIDERARNTPFIPRTTPLLVTVVQQGGEVAYALPGSQPIDRAFTEIKQAAFNAHRELDAYMETRRSNRAILIHQLSELERACSTYQSLVAQFTGERDVDVLVGLEHMARRLRKNLQMVTDDTFSRDDRPLANESFERFSALRMFTSDVIGRIRTAEGQLDPNEVRDSATVVQALASLDPVVNQWPDYRALVSLTNEIEDALVVGDGIAVRDSTPNWEVDVRRLASATALDLEAWLYEGRKRECINALVRSVESRLAEQGMEEVQCVLMEDGLDEFLIVTMVVVARIHDVSNARAFLDAVEEAAFAVLPEQVRELILVTVDAGGNVLPVGFRRFRDSTPLPQELALNPFAPWYPIEDVATYAEQVERGLARAEHPVAQLLTQLDQSIQRLGLAFGHFCVLTMTAFEGKWEVGLANPSRVVERLQVELASVQEHVNAVRGAVRVGNDWESLAAHSVRSATHYLELMLRVIADQADPNQVAAVSAELGDARNALTNMRYLGVAPPLTDEATIPGVYSEFEQVRIQLTRVFDQMRTDFDAAILESSAGTEVNRIPTES